MDGWSVLQNIQKGIKQLLKSNFLRHDKILNRRTRHLLLFHLFFFFLSYLLNLFHYDVCVRRTWKWAASSNNCNSFDISSPHKKLWLFEWEKKAKTASKYWLRFMIIALPIHAIINQVQVSHYAAVLYCIYSISYMHIRQREVQCIWPQFWIF